MRQANKHKSRAKRTLKIATLLFSIFLFFYIAFCGITVYRVYAFRKHPQRTTALGFFEGNLPHKILARALIFKRGTEEYNSDVMAWAYSSKRLSDSYFNRWILESALENAPAEERVALLPNYPLTPTERLIPFIKEALDRDRHEMLPLLGRMNTEESLQIARGWIQEKLLKPRNIKLFVSSSGSLSRSTAYPLPGMLDTFWPQLGPSQRSRVITKLAAHLSEDPRIANDLFTWTRSSLANGNVKMNGPTVALLGHFLSLGYLRDQTLELLNQHGNDIVASQIALLFYFADKKDLPQLANLVIEKFKDKNPSALLEVFHHVAHQDVITAEQLADSFLAKEDSEVRKGIIVILVRHRSVKGRGMITEVFRGTSPRKTMFRSLLDYREGNEAAEMYRKLSTHDYEETGKTWPPSYFRTGPSAEEIKGWRQFIDSYPWFPGTDDAYYRLAFSQFAQKDYDGCFSTIREYLKRDYWPDNDAKPYLMHLLRNLALVSAISDKEMPFIPHMRNIAAHPLSAQITKLIENKNVYSEEDEIIVDSEDHLEPVIQSINWFLSNPQYIQFLNTDEQTLKLMREVAETIQTSSHDSICRLIAAKLERDESSLLPNASELGEDDLMGGDEEPDEKADLLRDACAHHDQENYDVRWTSTIPAVLYGLIPSFQPPGPSSLNIQSPNDPGEEAIRQTATFLNNRFSSASIDDVRNGNLVEIAVLALLHSGYEFEKWENEFKPTMTFLSTVNNRDIPGIVSQKHQGLVARRTR